MVHIRSLLLVAAFLFVSSSAFAQLQNPGFENWYTNSAGKLSPVGWQVISGAHNGPPIFADTNVNLFGTFCDSSGFEGRFAAMVSRWYSYTNDCLRQRIALTDRPVALTGYYKYTDNELVTSDDTAEVVVFVTHWDGAQLKRDTVGYGHTDLTGTAAYLPFRCSITYSSPSALSDSVIVWVLPSRTSGVCKSGGWCSYLSVDDLSLQSEASVQHQSAASSALCVVPNPTVGGFELRPQNEEEAYGAVTLTDALGRTVVLTPLAGSMNRFDIGQLPSGRYIITTTTKSGMEYRASVVKQ